MIDSTLRFSNRVENYVKYRPGYPAAVLTHMQELCSLTPDSIVADIGSGTGILSELFLKNGNRVLAVEPNREMHEAGERLLRRYPQFQSVNGAAETTTLEDHSVDFVTAGQAFHWFDPKKCRREFYRILKPGGWLVVMWNDRRTTTSPFLVAYEEFLLAHGTDYREVSEKYPDETRMKLFFEPNHCVRRLFDNHQTFDFEGLKGRVLSASYVPAEGHSRYNAMIAALQALFEKFQVNGWVTFEYDTHLYCGQISSPY